jgi:putative transposase
MFWASVFPQGMLPVSRSIWDVSFFSIFGHPMEEEDHGMKKRFSEAQIAFALRQASSGTPVAEITRKMGITEQTFYRWKKQYGTLGVPEIRQLHQLEEENRRLKRLVADLTLDKQMLQDVLSKKL